MNNTNIKASEAPKKFSRVSNIIALVICFIVAAFIWLYVMQTDSPEYEETFTRVPLIIDNVSELSENSKLSVISGWEQSVSVTVKGRRSDIVKYGNTDLIASVDVGNITYMGTYSLDISVELPDELQLVSVAPSTAQVVVDVVDSKSVPVVTELSGVRYGADCELGDPVATPSEITVTGPVSVLGKVHSAVVKLELGEITGSVIVVAPVVLVDKNGDEIVNPYLKKSADSVSVTVPLFTEKTVPLLVNYKYGFYSEENCTVTVEPAVVTLKGEHSVLKNIESVLLKTLDEKQITSDRTETVAIPLPEGVVTADGTTSARITVTHIGTSQRTFTVTDFDIAGSGYTPVTTSLDITLRGPDAVLKRLTASSISVSASVEDVVGTGEFRVEAVVKLSPAFVGKVYELGTYYIQVVKK